MILDQKAALLRCDLRLNFENVRELLDRPQGLLCPRRLAIEPLLLLGRGVDSHYIGPALTTRPDNNPVAKTDNNLRTTTWRKQLIHSFHL